MAALLDNLKGIAKGKCPCCGKGAIFESGRQFLKMPVMYERCSFCGYVFDKEPGYFLGAMYFSYALAVLQAAITYFFLYFVFASLPVWLPITAIIFVLISMSFLNYKWSRIIWIYVFRL